MVRKGGKGKEKGKVKHLTKSGGFGLWKIILTTIVMFLFFAAFTAIASAATIYVPDNYGTIQDAVNAAADTGDTIIVRDDTYTENVIVNKRLTIRSENGTASTTVQAAISNKHVFDITADYVNISGFNVTGATGDERAGIYLGDADHCNVSDNTASNNYYGIELCYPPQGNHHNTLTSNNASHNDIGIYLGFSSNNNLTSNNASHNSIVGIWLEVSSSNNNLTSNTASHNDGGIVLEDSSNNNLTSNNASHNSIVGISLGFSSNHNTLTDNTASHNDDGIVLHHSSNHNTLTSNNASHNDDGIGLSVSSNHNTLTDNNRLAQPPRHLAV